MPHVVLASSEVLATGCVARRMDLALKIKKSLKKSTRNFGLDCLVACLVGFKARQIDAVSKCDDGLRRGDQRFADQVRFRRASNVGRDHGNARPDCEEGRSRKDRAELAAGARRDPTFGEGGQDMPICKCPETQRG